MLENHMHPVLLEYPELRHKLDTWQERLRYEGAVTRHRGGEEYLPRVHHVPKTNERRLCAPMPVYPSHSENIYMRLFYSLYYLGWFYVSETCVQLNKTQAYSE